MDPRSTQSPIGLRQLRSVATDGTVLAKSWQPEITGARASFHIDDALADIDAKPSAKSEYRLR